VGAAAGAVAGLVAVTPASGYIEPMEAIATGAIAGVVCYLAVRVINGLHLDDSLDVVGVHGVGGAWGAIATGLFATATVGAPEFREGLLQGEWRLLWDNSIGIVSVAAFSFVGTFIILKVLDYVWGIRVSEEDEELGLDVSQHGERAYTFDEAGAIALQSTILPAPPVPTPSPSEAH
jgi:Amt family ammonium transporter